MSCSTTNRKKMTFKLFPYQEDAVSRLNTGSILRGGVGSGKSLIALAYYFFKECGGEIRIHNESEYWLMNKPKDLYIITTAAKRDSLEWEQECNKFMLNEDRDNSVNGVKVTVDSWNNISKYIKLKDTFLDAFFIFDEQRVVGSGAWVKSFLKIAKTHNWILLSATPGDTWMDYIPIFIANGFYKNRTEFIMTHVVYNNFSKFPKIDHYIEERKLINFRDKITVEVDYDRPTIPHYENLVVSFDKEKFDLVYKKRWNPFEQRPIREISEYCYTLRKVVNSDLNRLAVIQMLVDKHKKIIVFYNFDYELYILRTLKECTGLEVSEYNGHKHESIPKSEKWVHLVQYNSGSEGWNCIETNVVVFYSLSYSHRMMVQAAGRIDRLNTPFLNLYYYYIISESKIDLGIKQALDNKKDFNEKRFSKGGSYGKRAKV